MWFIICLNRKYHNCHFKAVLKGDGWLQYHYPQQENQPQTHQLWIIYTFNFNFFIELVDFNITTNISTIYFIINCIIRWKIISFITKDRIVIISTWYIVWSSYNKHRTINITTGDSINTTITSSCEWNFSDVNGIFSSTTNNGVITISTS